MCWRNCPTCLTCGLPLQDDHNRPCAHAHSHEWVEGLGSTLRACNNNRCGRSCARLPQQGAPPKGVARYITISGQFLSGSSTLGRCRTTCPSRPTASHVRPLHVIFSQQACVTCGQCTESWVIGHAVMLIPPHVQRIATFACRCLPGISSV